MYSIGIFCIAAEADSTTNEHFLPKLRDIITTAKIYYI